MCTIDFDFSNDCYGKVTTAYPKMLMELIEDIYLFNQIFYTVLDKKIASDLEKIEIRKDSVNFHFYNKFKTLYEENWENLYSKAEEYSRFFEEVINEMKKNNNA
jgi:hypothetical protein